MSSSLPNLSVTTRRIFIVNTIVNYLDGTITGLGEQFAFALTPPNPLETAQAIFADISTVHDRQSSRWDDPQYREVLVTGFSLAGAAAMVANVVSDAPLKSAFETLENDV